MPPTLDRSTPEGAFLDKVMRNPKVSAEQGRVLDIARSRGTSASDLHYLIRATVEATIALLKADVDLSEQMLND